MTTRHAAAKSPAHLIVGCRGWRYDAWTPGFYPEDLPADWRLAYYANEFAALLVPDVDWVSATAVDLAGWTQDVPASFRFYLELPVRRASAEARATGPEQLLELAQALGDALAGFVLAPEAASGVNPNGLEPLLRVLGRAHPVFVLTRAQWPSGPVPAAIGCQPNVPGLIVGRGERVPEQAWAGAGAPRLCVLHNPGSAPWDLRALREIIEGLLLPGPSGGDAVILFAGEPPVIEDLRNAQTLAALLGG